MFNHFRLSESKNAKNNIFRVLSAQATLPVVGKKTSWVTITRTGSFTDPRYGRFEITSDMLENMVINFDSKVVGQEIFLDVNHKPEEGSAAKIISLSIEGARLRALVEWTEYGLNAVRDRGFCYLSAEFADNWQDNEIGTFHGPTLLGAGLTTRPVIKNLDPIKLSFETGGDVVVLAELADSFLKNARVNMLLKEKIEKLQKKLAEANCDKTAIKQVLELSETTLTEATLNNADTIISALVDTAKALSASIQSANPQVSQTAAQKSVSSSSISKHEVQEVVSKILAEQAAAERKKQLAQAEAEKKLNDAIFEAKGLTEEVKKELAQSALKLLPSNASDEQISHLADHQIAHGHAVMAAKKLSEMGYSYSGSPKVNIQDHSAKQLSQIYADHLKKTDYASNLALDGKSSPFADKVLSQYDREFAVQLAQEHKLLANGETATPNTNLPYGVVREVLRESLHDLNVLKLVQTLTDFSATQTTQIPYELRQTGQILNDGIVYEGQPIHMAGVEQRMDMAYINQMKLALSVTNEVIHFTRASIMNWDALARNIQTNARIMRELISLRIINQIQRSADSYAAINVTNETVNIKADTGLFSTVNWPVVRPYQAVDLYGKSIGSAENPISITVDNQIIPIYDGSNDQDDGVYYRIVNLNYGQFQLVNQNGEPVQGKTNAVVNYSYATNVIKFDLDTPTGVNNEKYLNTLLQKIGARKAMMEGQRYIQPDFMLMSPVLNDVISNAEQFVFALQRSGTYTTSDGDLDKIKQVPVYGTNAPFNDMGDSRIIMGVRGTTTYTVAKPFAVGELTEVLNGKGQPVGKKVAYGEEYNAIHTPLPIRNRYTSIIVYSSSALAASRS